ncbi:MAG TPA: hypothetical protein VHP37_15235 [Burkholderiales bacterium]|nr:hypothetical protein [Burkholderiales bacterium]
MNIKPAAIVILLFASDFVGAAPYLLSSAAVDPKTSAQNSNFQQATAGPTDSGLVTATGPGFSGSARAVTDFGMLKNFATATLSGYNSGTYGFDDAARADSTVSDYLTITGGAGTGYLKLVFDVTGSTSLSGDLALLDGPVAQGTLAVFAKAFPEETPLGSPVSSWGFTGPTTLTSALIPFQYGVAFGLTLTSSAFVSPSDIGGLYAYDFSGTADFGSTIDLTQLFVYSDPGGTHQENFSVLAGSGTDYPEASALPTTIPEPTSLMLVSIAFLGLGAVRARVGARLAH